MIQFSYPCMSTENTIALNIGNFVGKLMSLLFSTPCKFVIAFSSKEQASVACYRKSYFLPEGFPLIVILG